jgi:predicted DNA-binding transcriptional regulator
LLENYYKKTSLKLVKVFNMAKDKIIGAIVMILGILIAIIYTMGSVVDLWFETIGNNMNWDVGLRLFGIDWLDYRLFTVLPLWIMVLLIAIIAIWIGYSMLTTPAPVPLEELEEELAAEEESGE